MGKKILTINLGTTSTRVSLYDGENMLAKKDLYHPDSELKAFTQAQHVERRSAMVIEWMGEYGVKPETLDAIAMRIATLPKPVLGGTFLVEGALKADVSSRYAPDKPLSHGTDITVAMADVVCAGRNIPYYVVEPANQNNMIDEARITGLPLIQRTTTFHALNQKSVAHVQAEKLGKKYRDCNFVVAHLGGGISVSAHQHGRVIDTNNCGGDEGAFSGNRTGTLPALQLVQLCFSGKYKFEEIIGMLVWKGGVSAYLGTSDMREVEARVDAGDEQAALMFRTVAYRTAKEIGALCAAMDGELDGIILTGGMSHSKKMCEMITKKVGGFAPVSIYPGERESEALAEGALRIINHEEELAVYPG
ncbi:MAG: butyrate kinase [Oscillibacter sp.]